MGEPSEQLLNNPLSLPVGAPLPPPQPPPPQPPAPRGGPSAAAAGAQAFNVDLRSFQCEELPSRPQQHATPQPPQRDPDVWGPADPPAGSGAATPPLGAAHRARDGSWRERGDAYERLRRESLPPGGGGSGGRVGRGELLGGLKLPFRGSWRAGAGCFPPMDTIAFNHQTRCSLSSPPTPLLLQPPSEVGPSAA